MTGGRLAGKSAIVTGAGQGIGQGVALALAKEGASIAVIDISGDAAAATLGLLTAIDARAIALTCDVRRRIDVDAAVAATVAAFGTVDILVNNAQASRTGIALEDVTDDDLDLALGSGLYGTLYFMQAAFPYLKARGGKVINFGSGAGLEGQRGQTAYAAAKEAIRAVTRVGAREWGRHKINVNAICPAAASPGLLKWKDEFPEMFEKSLRQVPLGRVGDCEKDIGRAVVFLASEDSDFITGMTLMVDGGGYFLR